MLFSEGKLLALIENLCFAFFAGKTYGCYGKKTKQRSYIGGQSLSAVREKKKVKIIKKTFLKVS